VLKNLEERHKEFPEEPFIKTFKLMMLKGREFFSVKE
jgi:hypothetical protein